MGTPIKLTLFVLLWLTTSVHASDEKKPIQVRGQTRNLKMGLVLNKEKSKIKFVKVRENYKREILSQSF